MDRSSRPSPHQPASPTPTGYGAGPSPSGTPLKTLRPGGLFGSSPANAPSGTAIPSPLQKNRALDIIEGHEPAKKARFVKTSGQYTSLDQTSLDRATALVGLKGYVTNIPATTMSASEVIGSYHDLWHVEQSFRISKTDLAARPIFHRTTDAIEAHLTIVFTALAIARDLQDRTGWSIRKIIQTLRPLQHVTTASATNNSKRNPRSPKPPQRCSGRWGTKEVQLRTNSRSPAAPASHSAPSSPGDAYWETRPRPRSVDRAAR